ncbi:MAG TPA: PDZ domain-containing protein, partial [Gammaproteobacteria bacterium]|nr:PDZ domain-containing protein [Gammaproteobacteria bacterium]
METTIDRQPNNTLAPRARSLALLALALVLAGCGGGGGGGAPAPQAPPPAPAPNPSGGGSGWVQGQFLPATTFASQCNAPRSGTDPLTQQPYTDVQGTRVTENNWLRSWANDTYLWYNEIVDRDPGNYVTADYFALLKTMATTPSGSPKDRFHFTYPTSEWIELSQAGVSAGYGLEWAVVDSQPPRKVVAAYVQDGPAQAAGLQRGDLVLTVDGVDVVSSNTQAAVNVFVAGLYPGGRGEIHTFKVRDWQTGLDRSVTLRSENVTMQPVPLAKILPGGVGYLEFNDHVATAEQDLVAAIDSFRQAQITDLVLDLRYNG